MTTWAEVEKKYVELMKRLDALEEDQEFDENKYAVNQP